MINGELTHLWLIITNWTQFLNAQTNLYRSTIFSSSFLELDIVEILNHLISALIYSIFIYGYWNVLLPLFNTTTHHLETKSQIKNLYLWFVRPLWCWLFPNFTENCQYLVRSYVTNTNYTKHYLRFT